MQVQRVYYLSRPVFWASSFPFHRRDAYGDGSFLRKACCFGNCCFLFEWGCWRWDRDAARGRVCGVGVVFLWKGCCFGRKPAAACFAEASKDALRTSFALRSAGRLRLCVPARFACPSVRWTPSALRPCALRLPFGPLDAFGFASLRASLALRSAGRLRLCVPARFACGVVGYLRLCLRHPKFRPTAKRDRCGTDLRFAHPAKAGP